MEVVGLVLGVYPVVILVFEQFKTGAAYFSNWRRFRRHYEGFIRDIEAQQLFLEGTLQDLLCGGLDPYLSGQDSKETFLRIVTDPSYSGWTDPLLTENLRARLGKRYDWYMYTIRRIYDIYQEFQDVIDIEAKLQSSDRTPDWWRYQWERIKKTLFEERYEQHKEATRLISELKQMLALSDAQPQGGKRGLSSIIPFLNKVRINAYNLHDALKSAWHCRCNSAHRAMLQLERRDHDRDADFNLLFVLRSYEKQVLGIDKDMEFSCVYSCIEREASIRILENEKKSPQLENSAQNIVATTTSSQPTAIFPSSSSIPSVNNSEILHSPPVRPVSRSNKSRESVHSTAISETSTLSFFHGLKDKWSLKMRLSRSNTPATLISAERTQAVSFGVVPPSDAIAKSVKSLKPTARQSIKYLPSQDRESTTVSSMRAAVAAEYSPSNVAQESTEWVFPAATRPKPNRDELNNSEDGKPNKDTILDLCSTLHKSAANSRMEYILDLQKRHFRFLLGPTAITENECSITLQELLEGEPHRFPPMKRVLVATILASSLLQLQRTQWINNKWSKNDIFFRTRDGQVIFEQLYLATEFSSSGQVMSAVLAPPENVSIANGETQLDSTSTISSKDTSTTTSALSILPNAVPSQIKTSLECLGIILIELCLGEPIERRCDKVHVRPSSSATAPSTNHLTKMPPPPPPNHDFCLAIANAWTWEEINAYEPSFSDPIDMCLRFPNLGRVGQGRLDEVLGDVYAAVVRPLQDGLERRLCF